MIVVGVGGRVAVGTGVGMEVGVAVGDGVAVGVGVDIVSLGDCDLPQAKAAEMIRMIMPRANAERE